MTLRNQYIGVHKICSSTHMAHLRLLLACSTGIQREESSWKNLRHDGLEMEIDIRTTCMQGSYHVTSYMNCQAILHRDHRSVPISLRKDSASINAIAACLQRYKAGRRCASRVLKCLLTRVVTAVLLPILNGPSRGPRRIPRLTR